MNKLIQALDRVDLENVGKVNRTIGSVRSDILYFARTGKKRGVRDIGNVLTNYLSINQSQFNQNQAMRLGKRRFFEGLKSLVRLCNELE